MKSYCYMCKKKVNIRNMKVKINNKGRNYIEATCCNCGRNLTKMGINKEVINLLRKINDENEN